MIACSTITPQHPGEVGTEGIGHPDRRLRQCDIGAAGEDRRMKPGDVFEQDAGRQHGEVPPGVMDPEVIHHRARHLGDVGEREANAFGIAGRSRSEGDPRGAGRQGCGRGVELLDREIERAGSRMHGYRSGDQRAGAGVGQRGLGLCRA